MNHKLKLLSILLLGGTLAACGGGSSSSDPSNGNGNGNGNGDDEDCGPFGCIEEDPETELNTQSPDFPFHETFDVPAGEGNQVELFYSTDYRALFSADLEQTATFPDGSEYEDPFPSFYFPTCCMWETDEETGERMWDTLAEDIDEQQYVGVDDQGKGFMAISGARFTVGQLRPDIIDLDYVPDDLNYGKSDTSDAPVNSSWGELDLSEGYSVSFCLRDSGPAGAGTGGNLEVYVDNNSGGNQDRSMHGVNSLLLRTPAESLEPGNRMVVNVPGDTYLVDNNGERVGDIIESTATVVGTEQSFLQLRVSSGGYAVMSDLVIEHQSDSMSSYPVCEADDGLFEPEMLEGQPFVGMPLDANFDQSTDDFFGFEGTNFLAFPDDLTRAFYSSTMGTSRFVLQDGVARFGNSNWTIGNRHGDDTSEDDTLEDLSGGLDLSEPYRIVMEIDSLTDLDEHPEAQFNIAVDNNTSNTGNSIHAPNEILLNEDHADLETGELIINVPGEITMNGNLIGTIDEHVGTAESFLRFRCPGNCGDTAEDNDLGIGLSSLVIEWQDGPELSTTELPVEMDLTLTKDETFGENDVEPVVTLGQAPNYSMYFIAGGGSGLFVENGQLQMTDGARFTVGLMPSHYGTETTDEDDSAPGDLDLSGDYQITIEVAEVAEDAGGNFQVYVDNNTSGMSNSMHGGDSRVYSTDMQDHNDGQTITLDISGEDHVGTDSSFIQIRVEGAAGENGITLDGVSILPID